MGDKRGLSTILVTIMMIVLALVALAILWGVLSQFIYKQVGLVSTDTITIKLDIKYAKLSNDGTFLVANVQRNSGKGNLTAIKFIASDGQNSEAVDVNTDIKEFESHTFNVYLTKLSPDTIVKVSVAPILTLDSGAVVTGEILDTFNIAIGISAEKNISCVFDQDCGTNGYYGDPYCLEGNVYQNYKEYACISNSCSSSFVSQLKQSCGYGCESGACNSAPACSQASDCGTNGPFGGLYCSDGNVYQDSRTYSCNQQVCSDSVSSDAVEICQNGDVCYEGECLAKVECTSDLDCDSGKVCVAGSCVQEVTRVLGTVSAIFPAGYGEFIESSDFPHNPSGASYIGNYIRFTSGDEKGCLRIIEFDFRESPRNSFIRLDAERTAVKAGDSFEIWKTSYACSL
jgi:hypothetical protein